VINHVAATIPHSFYSSSIISWAFYLSSAAAESEGVFFATGIIVAIDRVT
jgi:hypothetical protein